ncbi:MAG: 4Fe-4S binding protein [Gemmatimonadaceae bacterium]|nr:4Fe-4S binding protein [Gemmatimonadaceae bacterium]
MAKASSSIPVSTGGSRVGMFVAWLGGRFGKRADRHFRVRVVVQAVFAITCIVLGVQFARWVGAAQAGTLPLPQRPAGVEGFLPISGLMGLLDWIYQGSLNVIHPAATVLVLIAIALALLMRKAFCSWVCPIGFLSEWLAKLGRTAFGRNFKPWKWVDIPLRSLKYLLMAFFVLSILSMGRESLTAFLTSPYNKVADVKMGLFFAKMSTVGLSITAVLVIGSIFIQGLWCRYLCPYGALLGLFSWASPSRIRRDPATCVDCGLCDKACPSRLPVMRKRQVVSPDCSGCLDCVAACPIKGALAMKVGRRTVSPVAYAAAVMVLFFASYVGARATGTWHSKVSDQEYVERIQNINSGEYGHPGMEND